MYTVYYYILSTYMHYSIFVKLSTYIHYIHQTPIIFSYNEYKIKQIEHLHVHKKLSS